MVEPPSMDKCLPWSRVLALTKARVVGLPSLLSPPAWTSVVWATFVKLFGVDILLLLQARSDVSGEESLYL